MVTIRSPAMTLMTLDQALRDVQEWQRGAIPPHEAPVEAIAIVVAAMLRLRDLLAETEETPANPPLAAAATP
jgi:hypothetical protein